jgi:Cellulose biosynthesis protein BcsS
LSGALGETETLELNNNNIAILVVGACALSSVALAADPPSLGYPSTPAATAPRYELLSSVSATTQHSWDNYIEGTAALWGTLKESGLRGRVSFGAGGYDYPTPKPDVDFRWNRLCDPWSSESSTIWGRQQETSFLLGYELVAKRWSLMGLIGRDVLHASLSQPDPENEVQGTKWGLKTVAELDSFPTDKTMFYAYASYSTAFRTSELEIKPGYLAFEHFSIGALSIGKLYVGPHVEFFSDSTSQIWKAGAQATAARIGPLHATVAVGYVHDSLNGAGAYGLVETWIRF